MKILAIGDFQGKFPKKLQNKIAKEKFDLIAGVGDYTGVEEWRPWVIKDLARAKKGKSRISPEEYFGKEKFKKILKKDFEAGKMVFSILDKLKKPGIFVFGNGDNDWYDYPFGGTKINTKKSKLNVIKKLKNLKNITYKKIKLEGISFIGFGGYMDIDAYFDKKS